MTKQEEIFYILQDVRLGNLSENEATLKLNELGIVIKVDRPYLDMEGCYTPNDYMNRLHQAGYVAVGSLIKGEKNEG